jgi:uncharacterized protein YbjQ (UPF0145 family)
MRYGSGDYMVDNDQSGKIHSGVVVVTMNYVPGHRITKIIGPTVGLVVRSRGVGGNIVANLRSIVGGEIKEYTRMLSDARQDAIQRLETHAKELGANAVVSMGFDSSDINGIMTEIVAYGTAVVVEKEVSKTEPVSLR